MSIKINVGKKKSARQKGKVRLKKHYVVKIHDPKKV